MFNVDSEKLADKSALGLAIKAADFGTCTVTECTYPRSGVMFFGRFMGVEDGEDRTSLAR